MLKRIFLALILLTAGHSILRAERVRISMLFVHYSVGEQIVAGYCWDDQFRRNIRETLDTMTVFVGTDTARIVFRGYDMNSSENCLSDTVGDCGHEYYFNFFNYDLSTSGYNRMKIWNSWDGVTNQFAGILKYFFERPAKEDSLFWTIFEPHNVPTSGGDSLLEKYDLVIIKNPYICWGFMDDAQADSIEKFFETVRDTVINHPEINLALAFGTPLNLHDQVLEDTAMAKITYHLANWFASDSFFTHSNTGPYKNLWKWDSYRPLCETSPDSANRYCLKNEYWFGDNTSHLSLLGQSDAQDSLVSFIRRATEDILIQRAGVVTRQEIDLKIKDFKEGNATEQEVLDLIEQYNSGG